MRLKSVDELSEKGRVLVAALFTLAVLTGLAAAIDGLGLSGVWLWIHGLAEPQRIGATMALWGGAMLAIVQAPRVAGLAGSAALFLARAGTGLAGTLVFGALRCAIVIICALPGAAFGPACDLGLLRGQLSWAGAIERTALLRQRMGQEWTLWRAYRGEFRGQFSSYRAFRRRFAGGARSAGAGARTAARADDFTAACRLIGLPEDGRFGEEALKARYRALMKELHPDRGGSNARAAQVNAACALIKKRKEWS